MERAVAVDEGACGGGRGVFLLQSDGALSWRSLDRVGGKSVGLFGDDDPGDEVGDGADSGEAGDDGGEDADGSDVPAILLREGSADTGDHAVVAWAHEAGGDERLLRRGRWDRCATVGTEPGGGIHLLATTSTEHGRFSG